MDTAKVGIKHQSINHNGYIQNHATPSYKCVDNMNQDFTLEWASK